MPREIFVFHRRCDERRRFTSLLRDHFRVRDLATTTALWQALSSAQRGVPRLVFTEATLPKDEGLALLRRVVARAPRGEVIAVSPVESISFAVATTKAGCFGFVGPHTPAEEVLDLAYAAIARLRVRDTERACSASVAASAHPDRPRLRPAVEDLLAQTEFRSHAVIVGEPGTGRQTVARLLHSARPESGMLRFIDCATLGAGELASSLGIADPPHGASTAAQDDSEPSTAVHATVCLLRSELLPRTERATLQAIASRPVAVHLPGGTALPMCFRVLAVAHSEASERRGSANTENDTLADLLDAPTIALPPLRRTPQDIPTLCDELATQLAQRYRKAPLRFSSDALDVLVSYAWPGNVSELENVIQRLTLVLQNRLVVGSTVPLDIHVGGWRRGLSYRDAMEEMERQFLTRVLERVDWSRRRAADRLSLPYSTLKFRMRKLKVAKTSPPLMQAVEGRGPPDEVAKGA